MHDTYVPRTLRRLENMHIDFLFALFKVRPRDNLRWLQTYSGHHFLGDFRSRLTAVLFASAVLFPDTRRCDLFSCSLHTGKLASLSHSPFPQRIRGMSRLGHVPPMRARAFTRDS